MEAKERYNVKIEKIIYGGKSLAKIGDYPVFTEGGCPEDVVLIEVTKKNKHYGYAKIVETIEKSKYHTEPFCPLHKVCGGCGLQQIEYSKQLTEKENIVKETIKKFYGEEVTVLPIKFPKENKHYRYKVQYPVSQTKVSKRIIAGYYKRGTHETVNIKYCPVQPEILDEITDKIRNYAKDYGITGYSENTGKGLLRHIVYRMSSYNKKILVMLVINSSYTDKHIRNFAKKIYEEPQITGVCINYNTKKTNVITGEKTECIEGQDFIEEKIGSIEYKIGANSFFQVNPQSAEIIFNTAKEMIQSECENPSILDAYSGVSAFGLQMKDFAKEIICVEESKSSTDDAKINVAKNKITNVKIINEDAEKVFKGFVDENRLFDVVLLDPPRKGCSEKSLEYAAKLSNNVIIYTSCNPSSLAADLKKLKDFGFIPKKIQPVDMFCHTPHIENVVLITKGN